MKDYIHITLEHLKVAIIRLCMGISNEIKVPMIAFNETVIFDNIVAWWQQRNLPKRVQHIQSFEFLIKTVPFFWYLLISILITSSIKHKKQFLMCSNFNENKRWFDGKAGQKWRKLCIHVNFNIFLMLTVFLNNIGRGYQVAGYMYLVFWKQCPATGYLNRVKKHW